MKSTSRSGMKGLAVMMLVGGMSLPVATGCLAPPPYTRVAPPEVARLAIYVEPKAKVTVPPTVDADAFATSIARGVADAFTQVGFHVVTNPAQPHDLRATVSANVQRSGNSLGGESIVSLDNHGVVVDAVRYDPATASGYVTYTNYVNVAAPGLANLTAHSKRVKKFARSTTRAPMVKSS